MTLTVICPLSGDPRAERALPSAYDAAAVLDAPLAVFSAVEDPHMVAKQQEHLEEVVARTRASGSQAPECRVITDPHAPRALGEVAAADDVVMVMATSTQPIMHAGYLGSAAERVARESYHPVVLCGPRSRTRLGDVDRVVVACDGSALSEQILPDARAWASRLDADLWIVTVVDPRQRTCATAGPAAEANSVRRLAEPIDASWEVLHSHDPARALADWAGPTSLVALTTHGRSGFSRLTLGSVATAVARWAAGPVLVGNQRKLLASR